MKKSASKKIVKKSEGGGSDGIVVTIEITVDGKTKVQTLKGKGLLMLLNQGKTTASIICGKGEAILQCAKHLDTLRNNVISKFLGVLAEGIKKDVS